MDPRLAVVAVVLVSAPLVGCLQEDGDRAGPEGLAPGEFLKVRYVERFEDGTVFNSTAGSLAPNTTLDDVEASRHDPDWWLFWTGFDRYPRGPTVLTSARTTDLTDDGETDVLSTTFHTVRSGQRLDNERISLWHLPPGVEDPVPLVNPGLFEALRGREAGDRLTDVEIPPEEGYAPPSEGLMNTFPRIDTDRERRLETVKEAQAIARGNFSASTREGDVISYEIDGWPFDARVERIAERGIDLYLLVEAGQRIRFLGAWNATILDVTNATYDLRHEAVEGQEIREPGTGEMGRVTVVNETSVKVDFNDLRAGRTMSYDVEIVSVEAPTEERDLWSHERDPVGQEGSIRDVEMIVRNMPTVATTEGVYFNPSTPRSVWFSLAPELDGRDVLALDASHAGVRADHPGEGVVYASVAGDGVHRSGDHGRSWDAVEGAGLDQAPEDLAASPLDPDVVHALVDGRVLASDDGGASWTVAGDAPEDTRSIAAGYRTTETLWAAAGDGVWRSRDGGATWNLTFDLPTRDVAPFVPGHLFAAAEGGGIYVTLSDGESWELQGTGVVAGNLGLTPRFPTFLIGSAGTRSAILSQNAGGAWSSILS